MPQLIIWMKRTPIMRYLYYRYLDVLYVLRIRATFCDIEAFKRALTMQASGETRLALRDGVVFNVRQNGCDASILHEIYIERPYASYIKLPKRPVIVDIGGYIGDFSIYAATRLNAERVYVFEPTIENYQLLKRNIIDNGLEDRICAENIAVGGDRTVLLNVQVDAEFNEVHASSQMYFEAERRSLPALRMEDVFEKYRLQRVDLLKIDCEGGEYDILDHVLPELFQRIDNIIFEYHEVSNYQQRLDMVCERLRSFGYSLVQDGPIMYALK